MDRKSILIINDITGYGRVSTFAMLPIFAHCGFHPYVLPTALVSNTMDYGSAAILDTSSFMKNTIKKWSEFGFQFDTVTTGLINSEEQVELIFNLLDIFNPKFLMVDPIMADDGKLYPDMYNGAIECNRKLIARSDLILPNFTEATMLAGKFENRQSLNDEEYEELVNTLLSLNAKDIVITGCEDTEENTFNLVYSSFNNKVEKVYFERINDSYIGTGDVFSATLLCSLLSGKELYYAVEYASNFVIKVIEDNQWNKDHYDLYLENSLVKLNFEL